MESEKANRPERPAVRRVPQHRASTFHNPSTPMPRKDTTARDALTILAILKRIPRSHWITTTELLRLLAESGREIAPRRMQRILRELVDEKEFGVELDARSKPFAYRRRVPDANLAGTKLSPQVSLLIRMAEEYLKRQLPAPLVKSLDYLFEEARLSLNEAGATSRAASWLKKVDIVPDGVPMLPPNIKPRIFDAVSEALYRESKLEIDYVNHMDRPKHAVVSPLGLVQQAYRVYLVCRFEGYDNVRHLALHRLENAVVLDFPAERPKNFTLDAYIASRHFNYSNGGKVRLELEFESDVMAKNLCETPLTRTQKLERLPDGFWRLEADVDDTVLLDGWIAAWSKGGRIRNVKKARLTQPGSER